LFFQRPKNENSPLKTAVHIWFLPKKSGRFSFSFPDVAFENFATLISSLAKNKRSCSKKWNFGGQNCVFLFFRQKFCHAVLDFCKQQGMLPDLTDHARLIAITNPNRR
jgi:hypothetical protein